MMRDEKIVKRILLILLGIVISVIGAMIWMTGGYEQGGLLQQGEIYEFSEEDLNMSSATCIYDNESQRLVVQTQKAELYLKMQGQRQEWNYCSVNLRGDSVLWNMEFLNPKGKVLYEKQFTVKNGMNHLEISVDGKIQMIKITMHNQQGYSFLIKDMKLRQKYFDMEDFLKKTIVIFLLCVVVYMIAIASKKLDWYIGIDILQNLYMWLGNAWGAKLASVINLRMRKKLQILCFFVMFLLMIIMDAVSGGNYADTARYWIFGQGLLLVLAGVLSWNAPLKKLDWRNGLCLSWLLLWVLVCVSDVLVWKSFSYIGYIMLFCAGFAFFVWHNTNCFMQVMGHMFRGLEWTFPLVILYCVLFRQKKEGIHYNGCFAQPEHMAMYALALMIAFLADLNGLLQKKELHKVRIVISGIGIVLSGFFLYYSRIIWCLVAAVVIMMIWAGRQLLHFEGIRRRIGIFLGLAVVVFLCGGALAFGIKYGIQTLPEKLGTSIIYEGEVQKTDLPEGIMYALEAEQPGWMYGVIRETSVEQQAARRTYIQQLNLLGHEDNINTDGVYLNPANGILQMAHRYGIFILIPYLVMWGVCVWTTVREGCFWSLAVLVAFLISILGGNSESPFTQPLWLVAYISVGRLLGNKEKEDMRLDITYENCDGKK